MPKAGFDLEVKNQPYWYPCNDVNESHVEKGYLGKGPKKNDPLVFGVNASRCDVTNMQRKKSKLNKNELADQMWEIVRNQEGKILRLLLAYTAFHK